MPFESKSLTHLETHVKIDYVGFEGPLSQLISEEEFNSMSQSEIEQKIFKIALSNWRFNFNIWNPKDHKND